MELDVIILFLKKSTQNFIIRSIFELLFYGGGIFGIAWTIIYINSMRIFSFIKIYPNKNKYINHSVFYVIDRILRGSYITASIYDLGKKAIAEDLIHLEVFRVKQILKNNLKFIINRNKFQYLKSFNQLKIDKVVLLFINEYIESKSLMEIFARNKMTRNNYMSQDDFNRFWKVYKEHTSDLGIGIYDSLNKLLRRKNLYECLFHILDEFETHVEVYEKTIAKRLNSMNGRIDGICYKGFIIGEKNNAKNRI
jgi:hypothetical protein